MFEENEIQDGIDDEIAGTVKVILVIISTIIGIVLGAVIGFYGLLFFMAYMQLVGFWPFIFFTVPIGMIAFGGLGIYLAIYLSPSTLIKLLIAVFFILVPAAIYSTQFIGNVVNF